MVVVMVVMYKCTSLGSLPVEWEKLSLDKHVFSLFLQTQTLL